MPTTEPARTLTPEAVIASKGKLVVAPGLALMATRC